MRRILVTGLLAIATAVTLSAQAPPTLIPQFTNISLAQTAAWIEQDAAPMLYSQRVMQRELRLDAETCTLSYVWGLTRGDLYRTAVSLKDIDPRSIVADFDPSFRGNRVELRVQAGAGHAVSSTSLKSKKLTTDTFRSVSLYVRSAGDGERLANALMHATILCGAPVSVF